MNRIDEVVVFHSLDQKNIEAIAKIQIDRLIERVQAMEMDLKVTDSALAVLAQAGFYPVFGARPLKRAIQQKVENPLSKLILEGKYGEKDVILVDAKDNQLIFE
ncbi:ATP-dependent chaperone ClpB [Oligella ureolytica]